MNLTGPEITVLVNVIMLSGFFGGMVMLIRVNGRWLADIAKSVNDHARRLADHDTRICTLQEICEERHRKAVHK